MRNDRVLSRPENQAAVKFRSSISKFAVLLTSIVGIAALSRCGGGSPQPSLAITTPSLPNGTVGTSYSQTIQAIGGAGPFAWSVTSGSLPHNLTLSTSTGNLSGVPDTAARGVSFTVGVTDSSRHSSGRSFSISILPQPDNLGLSPPSLDFSPQLVGNISTTQTETLTNNGSSLINIANIAISGTNALDFGQSNSTCGLSLAPSANCTFDVKFSPGHLGPHSASISITDDTGGSPQSVPLTGVGLTSGPNATLSARNLSFNSWTSFIQSITLSNYGTADLNVSNITATANFNPSGSLCMPLVASGASCTISISFAPATAGNFNGTLSINDNAPGGVQTVSLQGTAPTLDGLCWGGETVAPGCPASAEDLAQCPRGELAIKPVSVSGGGLCGFDTDVVYDNSRACQATDSNGNTVQGHCKVQ